LKIKTPSLEQLVRNLSGGNQQKVILARFLSIGTKVIIMDEPTRGIDVGTKSEIYRLIYKLAESGKAIILVSSDLPEVLGISDRVIVMRDGQKVTELDRADVTEKKVLHFALPENNKQNTIS
jgi:ABC-type sugar transport system ATPase subunit